MMIFKEVIFSWFFSGLRIGKKYRKEISMKTTPWRFSKIFSKFTDYFVLLLLDSLFTTNVKKTVNIFGVLFIYTNSKRPI